ncbi:MAG: hypothetical protein HY674_11665, partial [Chloroflexi bacterium]|nr:hypothetical protein [Chloroflexota bacterium]
MSEETLSLLVELLFTAAGVGVVAGALLRHRIAPAPQAPPAATWSELVLTAGGLVVAAVGPNILVVALTPGMPEMPLLARYALLPSLALIAIVWILGKWLGHTRFTNRICAGLWVGAAASGVLDAIRLTGFYLGQMPGN